MRLTEHLACMLDGEETMCKRSVWMDANMSIIGCPQTWYIFRTTDIFLTSILFVESWLSSDGLLEYLFSLQYELLSDKHCDLLPNSKDPTFDNNHMEIWSPLVCWYIVPQLFCRIWPKPFCLNLILKMFQSWKQLPSLDSWYVTFSLSCPNSLGISGCSCPPYPVIEASVVIIKTVSSNWKYLYLEMFVGFNHYWRCETRWGEMGIIFSKFCELGFQNSINVIGLVSCKDEHFE